MSKTMIKMFEPLLLERVEEFMKSSNQTPGQISSDQLADEILTLYTEDYKDMMLKHFKMVVNKAHQIAWSDFIKRTPNSQPIVRPIFKPSETTASNIKRVSSENDDKSEPPSKRMKISGTNSQLNDSQSDPETPEVPMPKKTIGLRSLKQKENLPKAFKVIHSDEKLSNFYGDDILTALKDNLLASKYPTSRGVLIYGPKGCGKSLLAHAITAEFKLPVIVISAKRLFRGFADDREKTVNDLFVQAENLSPCFVLIEDIDSLGNKSESTSASMQEKEDIDSLVDHIEDLNSKLCNVFIVATACKLENVDVSLRQDDIFEVQIPVKLPDLKSMAKLLEKFSENIKKDIKIISGEDISLKCNVNMEEIAYKTPAFSGKNLQTLVKRSSLYAIQRTKSTTDTTNNGNLEVEVQLIDFLKALKVVKASAMIEDYICVPDVTWKDIGALDGIRQTLEWNILKVIERPESAKEYQLKPQGVMLFGPPGCGKTLVAKALANEASLNFLSVKGPELLSKYVGESERNIRMLFQRAQECSPCLIFFDEIDSICETRSSRPEGGAKVVQQLLTELDGVTWRDGIYVMGATNRLDCVDPAFLRGNRFGTQLYIGVPSAEGRLEILKRQTENLKLAADVDFEAIARDKHCENFSGADLNQLINAASTMAFKESFESSSDLGVCQRHFESVLETSRPSVKPCHLENYKIMENMYGSVSK